MTAFTPPPPPPPSSPLLEIGQVIDSLNQQISVLGLAVGSLMKHTSLNNPELARTIENDLFPLLDRLSAKLTDSRTQNLIHLLRIGITEGRDNGDD